MVFQGSERIIQMKAVSSWLRQLHIIPVVAFWLMIVLSVVGVYGLGYQRGQIAVLESEVAR